jgi:hypothetical protein
VPRLPLLSKGHIVHAVEWGWSQFNPDRVDGIRAHVTRTVNNSRLIALSDRATKDILIIWERTREIQRVSPRPAGGCESASNRE